MPDQLSISNLLSLLQVDHNSQAIQLAVDSGRLVRQRCYDEAMKTAESAVRLAQYDYTLLGVTLLYQSHARLASHQPRYEQLAVRDCDRGVRNLSLTPFNQAIAQLIRGQVELQCKDHDCQAAALPYFNQAAMLLQKLVQDEHELNHVQQAEYYRQLYALVSQQIAELSLEITAVPQIKIAEKQEAPVPPTPSPAPPAPPAAAEEPVREAPPVPEKPELPIGRDQWRKLFEETQLIWPEPEPVGWQLMPFVPIAGQESKWANSTPDYIEISQLSIQGRPYTVEPLYSDSRSLRLQAGQMYIPLQVAVDGGPYYALVRKQDHVDPIEQFIAVMTDKQRVWTNHLQPPRFLAESPTRERHWEFRGDSYADKDIRIIGIIEAILTPVD